MPNLAIQIRERHLNALSVSGNNLEKERDGGRGVGVRFEKLYYIPYSTLCMLRGNARRG